MGLCKMIVTGVIVVRRQRFLTMTRWAIRLPEVIYRVSLLGWYRRRGVNCFDWRESVNVAARMRVKDRIEFDRLTLMRMWLFEKLWSSFGRAVVVDVATRWRGRRVFPSDDLTFSLHRVL